jgi:hypothetical protein
LDLNGVLNIVLVVCAVVFVVALVYRMVRAGSETRDQTEADRQLAGPMEEIRVAPLRGVPARKPVEEGPMGRLFERISTESPDEVRESAKKMLDYAILRGGATHVRPEILEKIALQFGLLEVALRQESWGEDGPRPIPDEEVSEMLRESFRRAASQARA